MNRKVSILIILFIIGLIFFDAAQQKYYLDEFDLSDNEVTFLQLLQNHFVRWVIWGFISLPVVLWIKKSFFTQEELALNQWGILSGWMVIVTISSLIVISIHSIIEQQLSMADFGSVFQFFIFQKGLTFLMASIMLVLLMFNQSRVKLIDEQEIEIENLKRTTSDLETALKQEVTPHLNIKTGYRLHSIPLDQITWIQSDDYCVKVHTNTKAFTLRKSLKSLENKLTPFGFIRIHRTALLNMEYMDQVNFESASITMKNKEQIPCSKNGLKMLKGKIQEIAV